MNDRPDALELLRAVERFLEVEVVPALDGVLRFHARVAANVVAIVARELETQEGQLRSEWEGLSRLLGDTPPLPDSLAATREGLARRNEELVRRIRSGAADQGVWREAVLSHLERVVAQKLEVSHPPRQR
jgi:hypothetical protein